MAIIIVNDLPPEVTAEQYRKVSDLVEPKGTPDGMLFHTGYMAGDHIRVVDAWESREKFEAFRESVLVPAIIQVMPEALPAGPPPEPEEHEPLDLQTA